uniref:PCQ3_90 n=1 Tax=Streptomyces sp. W9 TaxID=682410 RepID=D0UZD9_9ACTN|nr:hypothetical protein [Streptomyces sp. W9]ACX85591.1 pCQ3_90 [Streptomyces sp. W9]
MRTYSPSTIHAAKVTADYLAEYGVHTGPNFADPHTGALDPCAAAYRAITGRTPGWFTANDGAASIAVLTLNEDAMDVIRLISDHLDTEPPVDPETQTVPDYIEHLAYWVDNTPPSEVIGRILRAAHAAEHHATAPTSLAA